MSATTEAPPRLSREQRQHRLIETYRRRRFMGILVSALTVLVLGGAAVVLWGTSLLGLRAVSVSASAGDLPPDLAGQIRDAVQIADGTPLISIDLDAVTARVEAVPGVADAAVTRHWPGTLDVVATARVPVAVVAANSSWYLLDATGYPYQQVAVRPSGLISLRLATPGSTDAATLAGLQVVQALPIGALPPIASVTARSAYDITIELTDGRSVQWGSPADSARKAQVLPPLLAQPGTSFDISDPEFVTVR